MELEESKRRIRSAYEMALERHPPIPMGSQRGPRMDTGGGDRPIVEERESDSTYNEDMFVKNDHVSIQRPSFGSVKEDRGEDRAAEYDSDAPHSLEDITKMPLLPDRPSIPSGIACQWGGPMFDYGGYARMNRTFAMGLARRGVVVRTRPIDSITNVNRSTEDFLRKMSIIDIPPEYPRVYGQTAPDIISHKGRKILYTMMETSNGIHPQLADKYNMADEIWVPCTWNVETFKASGVIPEIRVMPLGVDVNLFNPDAEPLNFEFKTRTFRFISVFGWSYRKGFDVLIQAFLEEFSSRDDVTLILSSRFVGQKEKKDRIFSDFSHIRSLVNKEDRELPHIALHCDYTPDKDMPRLYRSGHCFVLPSRGEGFGLPYCEAGACEIPVIASDHGGQRDFLDDEVAYMVPPDGYYVSRTTDPPLKNMAWISHYYEDQEFPHYGRNAIETLKSHMRSVYENYDPALEKAKKLRKRLVENFNWDLCIEKVKTRLGEICEEI